jgi:hypothetical protein
VPRITGNIPFVRTNHQTISFTDMTDIKSSSLVGIDTDGADSESAVDRARAKPAESVPFTTTPEENGATMGLEKNESQLDQATLMATRPNGGWKAWLQVACGFLLMFNTYGATVAMSRITSACLLLTTKLLLS